MKKLKTFIAVAALSVTIGANVLAAELQSINEEPIKEQVDIKEKEKGATPEQPNEETVIQKEIYTVKPNDTLSDIALANDVTVDDIKAWNSISTDIILPGEELTIVNSSESTAVETEILADNEIILAETSAEPHEGQVVETAEMVIEEDPVIEEPAPVESQENTKEITFTATAYTASCEGCSGITATGVNIKDNPDKKVISVDPSVIPLGTEVYVEGYGYAVAADTGGAIKGNKIDVFIPEKQDAINWGKQQVEVKILN
jgi:3D (Asp-Asp-Asp) domain-containing protein/LysM repeat protein